ncbi:PTS sugar transporter subunit IIA [Oenococcus oeni]
MVFIPASLIQLHVSANNWQQAILQAAEPMVEQKIITKQYPNKIIQIAKETGPYIVITPHVALSHASTKDGALSDAIGLSVLEKPVVFHNKNNDPVKYIFTLSSTDPHGHLGQMSKLIKVISDANFFEMLNHEQDKLKIVDYIDNLVEN